MSTFSIISIFCEDIREEIGGTGTLVGILPTTVNVHETPFEFPKICVYTSIHFSSDIDLGKIKFFLKFPDNSEQFISEMPPENLQSALADARAINNPICGLVHIIKIPKLTVPTNGKLIAIVSTKLGEHIAGVLNIESKQVI